MYIYSFGALQAFAREFGHGIGITGRCVPGSLRFRLGSGERCAFNVLYGGNRRCVYLARPLIAPLGGQSIEGNHGDSLLPILNRGISAVSGQAVSSTQAPTVPPEGFKYPKLSKKLLKRVTSIERLYRPMGGERRDHVDIEDYTLLKKPPQVDVAREVESAVESSNAVVSQEYEPTKRLVKSIYKSATSGVFNDSLWKRYVHKLSIVAGVLHPADICLVLYSFAKVRYRDHQFLKIMAPLIVRSMGSMSCGGAALILNSMKRLELGNYDIIDLATNEICLKIDQANMQDISLAANALSFFHVYHNRFWGMLTKAVSLRHHQMSPLQASLILAAVAKLDIRNPLLLRILKDKLRPAVENGELSQELLTLTFHSLAKLSFEARSFYDACVNQFGRMLTETPEKVDTQSLVLYLYSGVCLLDIPDETVRESLQLLATRRDAFTNYKALKLKYVFDHLKHKRPALLEDIDGNVMTLKRQIEEYELKKVQRKLARWSVEISRILHSNGVKHKRNVLFDYIYADIYLKDLGVAVKCAGPYSYYAMSNKLTTFSQVEMDTLAMKGVKVCLLPYYEWNGLKTEKEKLEYLIRFGELWASTHFPKPSE